jgi:carbonic anhydrase
VLFFGNSDNAVVKEALNQHINKTSTALYGLIEEALKSKEFMSRKIKTGSIDALTNDIVAFNIDQAKADLVANSPYFQKELKNGKIGIASAFFNRANNSVTFSGMFPN